MFGVAARRGVTAFASRCSRRRQQLQLLLLRSLAHSTAGGAGPGESPPAICDNLRARELLADCTSADLDALVARARVGRNERNGDRRTDNAAPPPVSAYLGMDPTAASLHVGNLAAIMALRVLQRDHGVRPVLVVGSATASIGDPSGRTTERPLLDKETIAANAARIAASLRRLLDFDCAATGARVVDNIDWYQKMNVLDYLRDTALHFRLGTMLGKDSVRNRLQDGEQGLSLTEFSYMTLQAEDFRRLFQSDGCVVQVGGSDQWGNITAGVELIRRTLREEAAGITVPLMTTAAGEKLGKSAGNSVWLDAEMTSHYDFYQYWLRAADADVERLLKVFTPLPLPGIAAAMVEHRENPEARTAQRLLAQHATELVRGARGRRQAELASRILFGREPVGEVLGAITAAAAGANSGDSEAEDVAGVFAGCDPVRVPRGSVVGQDLAQVFQSAGTVPSKKQFGRLRSAGGLYLNNTRVEPEPRTLTDADLVLGRFALLRSGKKNFTVVEVVDDGGGGAKAGVTGP